MNESLPLALQDSKLACFIILSKWIDSDHCASAKNYPALRSTLGSIVTSHHGEILKLISRHCRLITPVMSKKNCIYEYTFFGVST